jgi:septal ring factor EnvC (AmiA/AmiB activator)
MSRENLSIVDSTPEPPLNRKDSRPVLIAGVVISLILAGVIHQIFSLKAEQQALALENARLSGMTEAHGQTLAAHESRIEATSQQVTETEKRVEEVSKTVASQGEQIAAQGEQIDQHSKDLKSVRRQVKAIQETPTSTVVVAATDEAAKKQAFDNWTKSHPEWKSRRSCMKAQMTKNPGVSLTDAYNACG